MDEEDYKLVRELRAKMLVGTSSYIEEETRFTKTEYMILKAKQIGLRVIEGGKH